MLEIEIADDAHGHYRVRRDRVDIGCFTREDRHGHVRLELHDRCLLLQRDRRVEDLARGRNGLLRAVWRRILPGQTHTLLAGGVVLARYVHRWGALRHGEVAAELPGGEAWSVRALDRIPGRLGLSRRGAEQARWEIPGLLRAGVRLDPAGLDETVALALAYAVHQVWGNDPTVGGGDA